MDIKKGIKGLETSSNPVLHKPHCLADCRMLGLTTFNSSSSICQQVGFGDLFCEQNEQQNKEAWLR